MPTIGSRVAQRACAEVLSTTRGLEALFPDWDRLWREDRRATPFQSPRWLLPWWKHVGEGRLRTLAHLHSIQDAMPRDREQPCPQGRAPVEPGQIAKRRDEDLLLHVLGQRRVAQRFAAVAIYRGPVSLHQESKRTGHILSGDKTQHITIGISATIDDAARDHGRAFSHIRRTSLFTFGGAMTILVGEPCPPSPPR